MSDDLISRKDFITEMEINIGNIYNPDIIKGMRFAIELINSRQTAFDKEKVRQELEKSSKLYRLSEKDCEFAIPQNIALEIVDNRGIK